MKNIDVKIMAKNHPDSETYSKIREELIYISNQLDPRDNNTPILKQNEWQQEYQLIYASYKTDGAFN